MGRLPGTVRKGTSLHTGLRKKGGGGGGGKRGENPDTEK